MAALSHSPDRFISLPFRKGDKENPQWSLCLKYISINHSSNNTTQVGDAFQRMTQQRQAIVKTCCNDGKTAPNENFIDLTLKPYIQLVVMAQAHLPLHSGLCHKNLRFIWRDSFDESIKYDSPNANLELVSNIFNLAAAYTCVGASDAHTGTVDGVKNAFKCFQNAAGYYEMVQRLLDRLPAEHTVKGDLKGDVLQVFHRLSLVQAHHCGYLKAENDMKGKAVMLSKIAWEGGKQYDEVASMLRSSSWYTTKKGNCTVIEQQLTNTAQIFYARAHLHLADDRMKSGQAGDAIGRFQQALTHLGKVSKMPTTELRQWVSSIIDTVNAEHKRAVASNESVYFMRVPKDLPTPEGLPRPMGKVPDTLTSFLSFESKRGDDPFFGIVPAHIATVASSWREKQRALVSTCTKAAASSRKNAQDKLQRMGVTAAVEVLSGEVQTRGRIPEQLRDRIIALRTSEDGSATGSITERLISAISHIGELSKAADSKIDNIKAELVAEEAEDQVYLTAYGERMWRAARRPSSQLPDVHSINAAVAEHQRGLQLWLVAPLAKTKQAMEESLRELGRLDWKMEDLDALMPFVETREAREQSQAVMDQVRRLKSLLNDKEEIEKLQHENQTKLQQLLESDSITFTLSAVESSQRDAVLEVASRDLADQIEVVNKLVRDEGAILEKIETAMEGLGVLQSADPTATKIQMVCNGLENAITIYHTLKQELNDIASYGAKAIDAIEGTLSSAQSFGLSRKLEAEELKVSLDGQIAAKMQEMERNKPPNQAMEESRQRQLELRKQIEELERQQKLREPERESRMADVLRRQKEVIASFGGSPADPYGAAPHSGIQSAPYATQQYNPSAASAAAGTSEPPPPSYNAVIGASNNNNGAPTSVPFSANHYSSPPQQQHYGQQSAPTPPQNSYQYPPPPQQGGYAYPYAPPATQQPQQAPYQQAPQPQWNIGQYSGGQQQQPPYPPPSHAPPSNTYPYQTL